jgi:hypothetical protein
MKESSLYAEIAVETAQAAVITVLRRLLPLGCPLAECRSISARLASAISTAVIIDASLSSPDASRCFLDSRA